MPPEVREHFRRQELLLEGALGGELGDHEEAPRGTRQKRVEAVVVAAAVRGGDVAPPVDAVVPERAHGLVPEPRGLLQVEARVRARAGGQQRLPQRVLGGLAERRRVEGDARVVATSREPEQLLLQANS